MLDKEINLNFSERIEKKKEIGGGVAEDKNEFATYSHKCTKCGYDKAQIIDLGIWYGDEDNIIRLRCGKCGFAEQLEAKAT
jgi:ribosomal protein S27AE